MPLASWCSGHTQTPTSLRAGGPGDKATVVDKMNVRVGGAWRYVLDAKSEIAFSGEYREIVPPERIVRTENFELMGPGHEVIDTVVFEEFEADRTKMTETMRFLSIADRDAMLQSGMESGFADSSAEA